MRRRLVNILIALDQLVYVLATLGDGYPDETISAAAWRMEQEGKLAGRVLRPVIDLLARPFEQGHCHAAYVSEILRGQLPDEYRRG